MLIGGFLVTWASLAVVAMLLSFMLAVGIAMARGDSLSCACFGLLYRERVGWPTQLRDGALLAMALFVLLFDCDAAHQPSPTWRRTSERAAAWATPWASPRPQPC